MNQEFAGLVVPFRDAVEPSPAAEEGPILLVTVDGKGIPMHHPVAGSPPMASPLHQEGVCRSL